MKRRCVERGGAVVVVAVWTAQSGECLPRVHHSHAMRATPMVAVALTTRSALWARGDLRAWCRGVASAAYFVIAFRPFGANLHTRVLHGPLHAKLHAHVSPIGHSAAIELRRVEARR